MKTNKPDDTAADNNLSRENSEEEYGGPKGPEPTRYGDWERNGRVSDF